MSKYFCLCLLLFPFCTITAYTQNNKLYKELQLYFPKFPYEESLDSLIHFYSADKDFLPDSIMSESGNPRFYVRGSYQNFNPFSFPIMRFLVVIERKEMENLFFQIAGVADSTVTKELVEKEMEKIHDKFENYFTRTIHRRSGRKEKPGWAMYNYYRNKETFPTLTIGWDYNNSAYIQGYFITIQLYLTLTE